MDNRGHVYCTCDADKPLKDRRPMTQITNRFGGDFRVYCDKCDPETTTRTFYRLTRRGPDTRLKNDRWRKGSPSTDFRALQHDNPRVVALSHYTRELHENRHSMLREMGLLSTERKSARKHITGNLRHDFWYALGALVNNLTINRNFATGRVSREVLDWDDVAVNGYRNGWAAIRGKKLRRDRRSAAQTAAARQRERNAHAPPVERAA